ncbi:unnamed protein product [Closterium sp. Yama58-4]|nr:unnamed protein product [Closterium sp. Yama58-4]
MGAVSPDALQRITDLAMRCTATFTADRPSMGRIAQEMDALRGEVGGGEEQVHKSYEVVDAELRARMQQQQKMSEQSMDSFLDSIHSGKIGSMMDTGELIVCLSRLAGERTTISSRPTIQSAISRIDVNLGDFAIRYTRHQAHHGERQWVEMEQAKAGSIVKREQAGVIRLCHALLDGRPPLHPSHHHARYSPRFPPPLATTAFSALAFHCSSGALLSMSWCSPRQAASVLPCAACPLST